jgi:phage gp36-like protein
MHLDHLATRVLRARMEAYRCDIAMSRARTERAAFEARDRYRCADKEWAVAHGLLRAELAKTPEAARDETIDLALRSSAADVSTIEDIRRTLGLDTTPTDDA